MRAFAELLDRLSLTSSRNAKLTMVRDYLRVSDLSRLPDEIVALARVAGRYGGLYATHMRNEGDKVADAIRESIQIGEEAGLPVEISHFKISNKKLWGQTPMTLRLVREARARGLVGADA